MGHDLRLRYYQQSRPDANSLRAAAPDITPTLTRYSCRHRNSFGGNKVVQQTCCPPDSLRGGKQRPDWGPTERSNGLLGEAAATA